MPARTHRSCGTGCSWRRAPEPPPCRRLHRPGPVGRRHSGVSHTTSACSGNGPHVPESPALGLELQFPARYRSGKMGRQPSTHQQVHTPSIPPAPAPPPVLGSCLFVVQQQLQDGLASGEEADLLDDVHPVVHTHRLVQAAIICKHSDCAEQGWGRTAPTPPCRPAPGLHPPVPRKRTS